MIIKVEPFENGAHANQSTVPEVIPEGWAVVPDELDIPETFPFVNITVSGGVVSGMTAGVVPQVTEDSVPSELEKLRADIDYIAVMTGVEL